MKLIILIHICTIVIGAQFEQGYVSSEKILAHKIYRQDIKFNNNFAEIPKIVLSVIGYHSDFNALDFFSKVTDITNEGFQLQVISDSDINQIKFNYLATEHQDVQTICNNIEVQKDQIDIKFNTPFEEQPQVAAFLTGIHRINQDDIILEIKSIDKNQVHLSTKSKAESSLGLCLLIGPQNLFSKKDLSIMQISQQIPNNQFYGISSLKGVTNDGISLSLNQKSVENLLDIVMTFVDINTEQIIKQEEDNNKNTVTLVDSQDKLNTYEQQEKQADKQIKIKSPQNELDQGSQINSISFIYPEQEDQLYIENEEQDLQQVQENVQEVMTISESWLQHDLSVLDQSEESLDSNQAQINEGQQFLTNLIKPQDYNTNSMEQEDFQSQNIQPMNIAIVDSTQKIINENQKKVINNQELNYDNSLTMDSTLDYDIETKIENQIEEQIDSAQQQNVVENLQDQIIEMQQEMLNFQQNSESNVSSELDPFKIIQSQQFIVEQQKQLVEQQQQIILQYQRLFEEQIKIKSEKQTNNQLDQQADQNQNQIEDSKQQQLQSKISQNQSTEQNLNPLQIDQNQEETQIQEQFDQNSKDQKYDLQDIPSLKLESQSNLEKDLESFNRVKKRKDEIDEQKANKLIQEFTEDLSNNKKLEVEFNDVLQIKQSNEISSNLDSEINSIVTNKRVEFSNIQKNMKTSYFQDINNQFENLNQEQIREAILPQEYEMEQAYFDLSLDQGFIETKNDQLIRQEFVQKSISQSQQSQEELQQKIEELLELENKDSHHSDTIFSDFHSFFQINQQITNNLRKRQLLNV
ncbi:unnamed protein product [Paramecium primaurelia]|uniref:H-type lectin domain-containing protein n=1 Tax=Paramecium primaurelia TaxID=5886 RepID=A0A8S1JXE3_PARPR|nr:unnamed protein product [Paramecium primaurelia]